jgi:hypothetical protein
LSAGPVLRIGAVQGEALDAAVDMKMSILCGLEVYLGVYLILYMNAVYLNAVNYSSACVFLS